MNCPKKGRQIAEIFPFTFDASCLFSLLFVNVINVNLIVVMHLAVQH